MGTRPKCGNCKCQDGWRATTAGVLRCKCRCHGHVEKPLRATSSKTAASHRLVGVYRSLDSEVRTIDALFPPERLRMPRFPNDEKLRGRSQELFADTLEGGDAVLESLAGWLYELFEEQQSSSSLQQVCRDTARRQEGHFWCELLASSALALDDLARISDEAAKVTARYGDAANSLPVHLCVQSEIPSWRPSR